MSRRVLTDREDKGECDGQQPRQELMKTPVFFVGRLDKEAVHAEPDGGNVERTTQCPQKKRGIP
jgi:hypothetical protein